MYLRSGTRRSLRLQMLWSVLLHMCLIQPVLLQYRPSRLMLRKSCLPIYESLKKLRWFSCERRAKVSATFRTFVEICKLMAKITLDFFWGLFNMVVAGRIMLLESFFVKSVLKSKSLIVLNFVTDGGHLLMYFIYLKMN